MPKFSYRARTKTGLLREGEITAASQYDAADRLMKSGFIPTSIGEKKESPLSRLRRIYPRTAEVKPDELMLFTSRLRTLFAAGIPLVSCFDGLIDQAKSAGFKNLLCEIKGKVEEGAALHEAMRGQPAVFSETYVNMVMAGEVSGTLDESLKRLVDILEVRYRTQNRITEILRYPKIVVTTIVVALTILMSFVVPRFAAIFEKTKLELPLPTRILIGANNFFLEHWPVMLLAFAGCYFAFRWYISTEKGRYNWHHYLLRAPLVGEIVLQITFGQFCHVLSNLLRSGVPIIQSIEIASRSTGNRFLFEVFGSVARSVREGAGMAGPLSRFNIVPRLVIQMIAAGENSGSLDEMLTKVADFFNKEAERKINKISTLLEPFLILALACIVLFIAVSIFLPMWDMTKLAGR
jgi:type II secretory pathway component PulF